MLVAIWLVSLHFAVFVKQLNVTLPLTQTFVDFVTKKAVGYCF